MSSPPIMSLALPAAVTQALVAPPRSRLAFLPDLPYTPAMRGVTAPTSRPRALRSTVVVADDDPDYRYFVRFLLVPLADAVTIVGEASDGEETMALVLRKRPDILVADLLMPLLNGIELTRRLKQELPATKIVLMTAYTEDANRRLALIAGADAFLDKTALTTELLPAIRDLVGSSR